MLFKGLFDTHFYGFLIIKVARNDETSGRNFQMGYETKRLKHGGVGQ